MKKIVLLISMFYNVLCFSQNVNPELFQTWYLINIQNSDISPVFNVDAINPPITPTLTISNTLNFTGTGACNTFNGVFTSPFSDVLQTTAFTPTSIVCSTQSHTSFEESYFNFLQFFGQYLLVPQGSGLLLIMNTPLFGQARFQNFPLNTSDFILEKIALYPNPSNSMLFLNSNEIAISKITILTLRGQSIKILSTDFEFINISDLASGIYILKVETEMGTVNRKFFKI